MLTQMKASGAIRSFSLLLAGGCILIIARPRICAQETRPVGKTKADQQRNAELLGGYDYGKYNTSLTGYTGQDRQRIALLNWQDAVRTRVGPRGLYKACMSQLPDGKLVVVTSRREPGYYKDNSKTFFTMYAYESADLGLTWQKIGKHPIPGKDGKGSLHGKEASLTTLGDGSLVMTAENADWTPAADHSIIRVCRSSDGGRTWEVTDLAGSDSPRNLIVEADGSLLMVRSFGWSEGNSKMQVGRSGDGGKTWEFSEGVIDWDQTQFGEVSAIRLPDGRLLASLRYQLPETQGEGFEETLLTESSDDGKHWSKPRRLTNAAEVHVYLTKLGDGRLLATYVNYHLPWGIYAIVSQDGGVTWDRDHPIQLALSADFYVGWPVTLQLADESLITSYTVRAYLKQTTGQQNVTEVVRWRLPEPKK